MTLTDMRAVFCAVAIVGMPLGFLAQAAGTIDQSSMVEASQREGTIRLSPKGQVSERSWRVAQEVSEKEAFALAKDVNSIDVWEAYLIKFPHGFRAAIAKSYINKLKAGGTSGGGNQPANNDNDSDDSSSSDDDEPVEYVRASELSGPFRLAARGMSGVYVNNTRPGRVTVVPNALDRRSGHWYFEQVRGTKFVRIRNSWKGTYLHLNGPSVKSLRKSRNDRASHWTVERAEDSSDYVVLRNRKSGWYLWTDEDDRVLYVSKGQVEAPRGHWRLVSMEERDTEYADEEDDEPITRPTKPRVTCTNGYVKNGSCRCGSGRERVKISRNKYRCNRTRTKCGRGEYYSKGRKQCRCKRGYERVGGQCLRNEELDDDTGNTSCPAGFLLRKGYCVCPRGKKNIQGVCRRPKSGGTVRPQLRCSKIKFAYTRGNTCKCAGGRVFTGRACVLRKSSSSSGGSNNSHQQCQQKAKNCAWGCKLTFGQAASNQLVACQTNCWQQCAAH